VEEHDWVNDTHSGPRIYPEIARDLVLVVTFLDPGAPPESTP
jgi:hypothetical protein